MGPAVGLAIYTFFTTATTYVVIIRTILVNVALAYLQRAAMSDSNKNLPPINVTIRDTVENRRMIFGRIRKDQVFYDHV